MFLKVSFYHHSVLQYMMVPVTTAKCFKSPATSMSCCDTKEDICGTISKVCCPWEQLQNSHMVKRLSWIPLHWFTSNEPEFYFYIFYLSKEINRSMFLFKNQSDKLTFLSYLKWVWLPIVSHVRKQLMLWNSSLIELR